MCLAMTARPGEDATVVASIAVDRHAPVASYTIHAATRDGSPMLAVLESYSRWSEPAVALVARCIEVLPGPLWLPVTQATGYLGLSISLRRDHDMSRHIERAYSWRHRGAAVVDWHDGDEPTETVTATMVDTDDARCALMQTLRLAAWRTDATPGVPRPLSHARTTQHLGRRGVWLAELPKHARRHLERRSAHAVIDGHVSETAWLDFIGRGQVAVADGFWHGLTSSTAGRTLELTATSTSAETSGHEVLGELSRGRVTDRRGFNSRTRVGLVGPLND